MTTVSELQKQLKKVTEERDKLAQTVRQLEEYDSGSMFSAGYVMSEQLASLQKESQSLRNQLSEVTSAKDQALQDLTTAKASIHALENALTQAKQQAREAATEKEFYQASAARAVADVESATQEVTALRSKLAELEVQLGECETQLNNETRLRKETEGLLAQRQQQLTQLRSELEMKKSEQAATSRQLTSARETIRKLETYQASQQSKLTLTKEDLERTRTQLQQFRESEGKLRVQWQEAQALAAQLQGTSKGQSEQLSSLTAELRELQESTTAEIERLRATEARLSQELSTAQEQVSELTAELRQAQHDLSTAEQRITEYQQREHELRSGAAAASSGATTQPTHQSNSRAQQGGSGLGDSTPTVGEGDADPNAGTGTPAAVAGSVGGVSTPGGGSSRGSQEAPRGSTGAAAADNLADAAARDAADDAEQLAILRTMVHDLKMKLALATQEKVQALLAMAELKQQAAVAASEASSGDAGTHRSGTHHTHHQSSPVAISATGSGRMGAGQHSQSSSGAGAGLLSHSPGTSGFTAFMASRLQGLSQWMPGAATLTGAGVSASGTPTSEAGGREKLGQQGHVGSNSGKSRHSAQGLGGAAERQPLLDPAGVSGDGTSPRQPGPAGKPPATPSPHQRPSNNGFGGVGATSGKRGSSAGGAAGGVRGDGGDSTDLLSPVQSEADLASMAGGDGGEAATVQAVRQLVTESGGYLCSLQQAAQVILGSSQDPSLKWNALTGLSKLHVQLNQTRARLGLTKLPSVVGDLGAKSNGAPGAAKGLQSYRPVLSADPSVQLTGQVLDLVDLSLTCLEAYQRQEALSSVMATA